MANRREPGPSAFARRFFALATVTFGLAGGLAWGTMRFGPPPEVRAGVVFPPAFWLSTLLLGVGSFSLYQATQFVRIERQRPFRRWLLLGLGAGTAFVGVQCSGLWWLAENQQAADVATGANAFVLVLAALHGLHFTVALLFLDFVTVRALADRYDHEYHWGVTFCGWFWHVLAAVWLVILGVFAVVA